MLPYFHTSGHFNYAKSAHIYLQEMQKINNSMNEKFRKFINEFFTIRRTDKFWSDIYSDMTIEQTLMKSMKVEGGLIERGITDSTVNSGY